jgi:hypothetical protein
MIKAIHVRAAAMTALADVVVVIVVLRAQIKRGF